ncbi:hypothetical protein ACTOJ1_001518 [Shigella flexneri]
MVSFSYILMLLAAIGWLYFRIVLAKPWHNFLFVLLISLIVVPNLFGVYDHPFTQQFFIPILVGMAAGDFSFRFVLWIVLKVSGEEKRDEIYSRIYNRKENRKKVQSEKNKIKEQEALNKKEKEQKEKEREKRRKERLEKRK